MLSTFKIAQLCSFSLFMAVGQFLFKMAAMHAPPLSNLNNILGLAFNPWLWGALSLYGVSTLIWISVLQTVPLSIAYPFAGLGFIVVPLVSFLFFKEPLTWQYGIAVVLILIALKLIAGSGTIK